MTKYVLTYYGGSYPETEAEGAEVMAAWSGWLAGVGDALVDGGNPVGQTKTIGPDGAVSEGGGADPLNGYSLVNADSLDDALAIATKCPHLSAGGTVRVHETVQM